MKINSNQWVKSLTLTKMDDEDKYNLNPEKWVHTLPVEKKNNSIKNYSVIAILFVCGLMFVSVVKNDTRNLQKNINIYQKSINNLKVDLHQETLDHEIITSPENLVLLAEEHLELNLTTYKKSQIKDLDYEKAHIKTKKSIKNSSKNKKTEITKNIAKKIKEKRTELTKLKKVYSNPKEIPNEIKLTIAKRIELKKKEISYLYENPGEIMSTGRVHRWAVFQLAKLFVGIPIIPGK